MDTTNIKGRCVTCGEQSLRDDAEKKTATVGGVTVTREISTQVCENLACGEVLVDGPALIELERLAALHAARAGVHTGEVFRALRKALSLKKKELAVVFDVTPEDVSKWENDQSPIDPAIFVRMTNLLAAQRAGRHVRP